MVKTATRTLDVFEAFAAAKRPLTLSELARAIGAIVGCGAVLHDVNRQSIAPMDFEKRVAKRLGLYRPAVAGARYSGRGASEARADRALRIRLHVEW